MNAADTPVRGIAWAAIDFEGSGAAPGQSDEAVQVGMAVLAPGASTPGNLFRSYIRVEGRVTREATSVHRISDRDLRGAPALPLLWPEIKARLAGAVVLAHGAGTERRFLRAFPLHGFGPWLDTLLLSRAVMPGLADHSLSEVAGELGVVGDIRDACPELDWHDALFDAVASLLVAKAIVSRFDLHDFSASRLREFDTAACSRHRAVKGLARAAGLDV